MACQEVQSSLGAEPGFFYGYIVVVAAFLIFTVTLGTLNTFGVFLSRCQLSLAGRGQ
ncbi:hypothetical protein ACFL4C_03905 [Candidatus Omnitrophota bacterium]